MATKRRKTNRRRVAVKNAAPRRAVRRRRRRNPPVVARARARRATINPRRGKRHRRRNPSGMQIGSIFKSMIYGAGGAILTRVGAGVAVGLVPGSLAQSPLAAPAVQAAIAVTAVRWIGKKFFGPSQGDSMMLGGLISAGLSLADAYFPNVQQTLTGIIRAPIGGVIGAPVVIDAGAAAMGRYRDVEEVPDSVFAGLRGMGDVEDVPMGIFGQV